ncbi:Rab3 GTPase-activating protein catalytic subunit [Psidium guajava]|nr:Rab3 GTPase-activating protein catalytic subunit [Psidium guajava]
MFGLSVGFDFSLFMENFLQSIRIVFRHFVHSTAVSIVRSSKRYKNQRA